MYYYHSKKLRSILFFIVIVLYSSLTVAQGTLPTDIFKENKLLKKKVFYTNATLNGFLEYISFGIPAVHQTGTFTCQWI